MLVETVRSDVGYTTVALTKTKTVDHDVRTSSLTGQILRVTPR